MPKNSRIVKYKHLGGDFCGISINVTELMPIKISIEKSLDCLTILNLKVYICNYELEFVEVNEGKKL